MVTFFSLKSPYFFTSVTAANILAEWIPLILIAVAETFVVISGGIDLSVGSNIGFSGIIAALAMRNLTAHNVPAGWTIAAGTIVAVATGFAIGFINALLVTRARLVPFIATLATLGAFRGLSIIITGGGPVGDGPDTISLTNAKVGPFSYPAIFVIILVVILGLYLHLSRFGRYTYAIGSNVFAARSAGINVKQHLTKVYLLSGSLAGLAGMYLYMLLNSGAPTSGQSNELDAIAAVVIGGVSLAGGVGRMTGTVLGAFILAHVPSGLILIGLASDWKQVFVAVLIGVAVFIQGLRNWKKGGDL